ncbi:MAG: terminase large subunit, partial [Bacteroides sp.]
LKVVAADSTKLDGPNPSMFLLDEYHAAKDTRLKDVLQSGQGMREYPMAVIITTAGFDKLGPCYEMRTTCTEILKGMKEDYSMFTVIYTLECLGKK